MPLSPRLRIRLGLALLAALLLFSVFGFMHAEHLSFVDALYFSVVTVTTVGYGDIHPSSPVGKILATVLILSGVFTFTIVLTSMTERLLNVRAKQERLQRLNMAIGSFFSEVGTELLKNRVVPLSFALRTVTSYTKKSKNSPKSRTSLPPT